MEQIWEGELGDGLENRAQYLYMRLCVVQGAKVYTTEAGLLLPKRQMYILLPTFFVFLLSRQPSR